MPYWGAHLRHNDTAIVAKINGVEVHPATDELIEYITNITKNTKIEEGRLAQFLADKIAIAFKEHPAAAWVTVDVLTTGGGSYGATQIIEQNV